MKEAPSQLLLLVWRKVLFLLLLPHLGECHDGDNQARTTLDGVSNKAQKFAERTTLESTPLKIKRGVHYALNCLEAVAA
jgi:hypothetical protein